MTEKQIFKHNLQNLASINFSRQALAIFRYQAVNNPVYRQYIEFLIINPDSINRIEDIPFLPIELFRSP